MVHINNALLLTGKSHDVAHQIFFFFFYQLWICIVYNNTVTMVDMLVKKEQYTADSARYPSLTAISPRRYGIAFVC